MGVLPVVRPHVLRPPARTAQIRTAVLCMEANVNLECPARLSDFICVLVSQSLCLYQSLSLSLSLSLCLSLPLRLWLSVRLYLCLSVCRSLSVCLALSTCLTMSVCLSACMCVCLFACARASIRACAGVWVRVLVVRAPVSNVQGSSEDRGPSPVHRNFPKVQGGRRRGWTDRRAAREAREA